MTRSALMAGAGALALATVSYATLGHDASVPTGSGDGGMLVESAGDDQVPPDVLAAREAVWRAWFTNDRAVLERMLPEDFIGVGWGGGPFESRSDTVKSAAEFATSGGTLRELTFSGDRVQTRGNTVTVVSNYTVVIGTAGQTTRQTGRPTEVFVKVGASWTNLLWHLDSGR